MVYKYTDLVLEHFRNPKNAGPMEDADAKATEGSLACGDMMTFYIKVRGGVLTDVSFESYGCAANIATGSVLSEMVKGMTLEEAKKVTWDSVVEGLGGLPQIKNHCSHLAIDTLQAAIKEYEKGQK